MKKGIGFILTLSLIASSAAFGFADSGAVMEFTGDEMKMSLEDVQTMMLTSSTAIEMAKYKEKVNKGKTKQYYEKAGNLERSRNASNVTEAGDTIWTASSPSRTQIEMADVASTFASEQTPRNYEAEVNQIIRDTQNRYYGLVQVKELLRISQENTAIYEKLYQNTQSKFNLGVVSKQDVLKAEIGLNQAKVDAQSAENTYKLNQMGFNILLGLDLMQKVTLTDTLTEATISEVPLDEAITKALENRNEIAEAAYKLKSAELELRQAANTVIKSSSTYQSVAAALMMAEYTNKNQPKEIEKDVRDKYMTMMQKKAAVEQGKLNVANAKETYRLANLQYDAGMYTLTDTQQTQIAAYQTELSYYATLLEYNLAIIDYEQSYTVGTKSADF